ncbi:MAG: hypothetical protein JW871_06355 [Endomicrobiales bacterium]|nr:hypothetical protein [Endomicrobiales bacterium]
MGENNKSLPELLLNLKEGRYSVVGLAKKWLDVLKKTDEGVGLSEAELIKKSIKDILSGKVTEKDIKEARNKMVKPAAADEDSKGSKGKDGKK